MAVASDQFTRANNASIATGAPFTWTLVVGTIQLTSNQANLTTNNSDAHARAEVDSANADNFATIDIGASTTLNHSATCISWGPCCRYSSSADTFYQAGADICPVEEIKISKTVAGLGTNLTTPVAYVSAVGDTLKIQAQGTTITSFINGVQSQQVTDSAITTGTRGGFQGYDQLAAANEFYDNFVFDNVATAIVRPITSMPPGRRSPGALNMAARLPSITTQTYLQALSAGNSGGATFQLQTNKPLSAGSTQTGSLIKQALKNLAGVSTQTGTLLKQANKPLTAGSTQAGTMQRQANKPLSATSTQTPTLVTHPIWSKVMSVTSTGLSSLVKLVLKPISASSTQSPTIQRQINKPLSVTSTQTATLLAQKVIKVLMSVTSTGAATMTRLIQKFLSGTTSGTPSVTRQANKPLSAGNAGTPTIQKQANKPLSAGSTQTATLVTHKIWSQVLSAASSGVVSMTRLIPKPVSAASTQSPTMARLAQKIMALGSTSSPTMQRQTNKRLTVTSTQLASMVAALARLTFQVVMSVTSTQTASLAKLIKKNMIVAAKKAMIAMFDD